MANAVSIPENTKITIKLVMDSVVTTNLTVLGNGSASTPGNLYEARFSLYDELKISQLVARYDFSHQSDGDTIADMLGRYGKVTVANGSYT